MSRNNIRVARGIRQTLPPNTILGNPYSTPGPAIIMTSAQLAGNLLNTGQVSSTASQSGGGGGGSPWTSFTQGTPTTITINSTVYTAVPLSPDIFPLVAGASTLLGARLTPGATFNKCGFALVNSSGDGYYLAIQSDSNLVLASFTASGQSVIDAGPGSHGTTTGEGYYNGNWKNSGQFDQSYQWLIEAETASANGFWVQQGLGAFLGFSADTTYDLTSGTWGFYFFYAVGDDPVLDWAGYTTPPLGSVLSVGSVPIVLPPGTTATTQSSGDTSTKVATDAFVAAAVGANQLTGDVTAGPGAGSQVATLATVNTDVGSYTLASVTVNAKGLVTAASSGSVSVPSGANPSGTAGPSAVDGSATTFMRSDGAPAVQKASSSQFGIVEVDNTTITASGGVISAVSGAAGINQLTGDVTAGAGVGSQAATLATVNSDTGTINGVTTNGKGLVTANVANGANPSGTAGPSAVNGSATTFMRSDGAPAVQKASSSQFGIVEVDNTTITASSGVISTNPGVVANYNVGTPAKTQPNSSSSYEMMGFGSNLTFTPKRTGNFLVLFNAIVSVDPTGSTMQAQNYVPCIGTGTPPSYGDAVTGNFGQGVSAGVSGIAADVTFVYMPISFIGIKTGLTIGTTYWFDLTGSYTGTQAQCALSSLDMTVVEL